MILAFVCWAQDGVAPSGPAGAERPALEAPARKKMKSPPQETPPERPAPAAPRPEETKIEFEAGLDLEYNDNVLRLSDRDVRRLEDGTKPEKFRIEEPGDFIYSPWVEAALGFALFERPAAAGLRLRAHLYQDNSILNQEEITLFARQKPLDFEYALIPEAYRREYRNLDTGQFESAFYTEHRFELGARFRPHEIVGLRPKIGLEFRDYESPFNHRDSLFYTAGLRGNVEVAEPLHVFLAYGFVLNDAFADSHQPDTSYLEHEIEPGVSVRPVPEVAVELRYRFAHRRYTTDNAPAIDPGHRGRTDDRRRLALAVRWKLSKSLAVEADYRRSSVDSDLPNDPGATDEETSWRRNEILLGVAYQF